MENHKFNVEGQETTITLDPSQDTATNETAPESKTSKKRYRRFALICYLPVADIDRYLKREKWVQHWAYCHHNKDVENGEPKPPHTHIILYTYDAKTSSAIRKIFKRYAYDLDPQNPQNTLASPCTDPVGKWHYLIHKYDPDKYQYPATSRYCDSIGYWTELCKTNALTGADSNSALSMVDDILAGLSTRELVARYGKDFAYHRTHLVGCAHQVTVEEMKKFALSLNNSRIAVANMIDTSDSFCEAIRGSYSDVQIELFREMLFMAMNNISVLEGWTIKCQYEDPKLKGDNQK